MTRVPLLDLQAQYLPLRDELLSAIQRVCDSQQFVLGAEVAALEQEMAARLDVNHAVAVSSGTDALLLALTAIGIEAGDEVVTSAYSFFATAGVIARLGARPVFVDIDPLTLNVDPKKLQAAITARTKAVIPVHLFGLSADMDAVLEVTSRRGVPVIEDAAQAIGATYGGRPVGGLGSLGCFSFYPTKNLGAFGDAGLVTTNDPQLAERVRLLRTHGMGPKYYHHLVGGNFRMDALQAAVLRVKASHLSAWTAARRLNASRYVRFFEHSGLRDRVALPIEPAGREHVFNQFVVRISGRHELRRHLEERGVGTEVYYPLPLHLQPCFGPLGYRPGSFPEAERAANDSLAIPMFPELTLDQQRFVVDAIAEFVFSRDREHAKELA